MSERLVLHHARLAPDVLLAEVVPMVGAHEHGRRIPQRALVERGEDLARPVVDHGELGAVVGPDVPPLAFAQPARAHRAHVVGRPDEELSLPLRVVAPGPRLGRVEGFVGVELVHEEQEGRVVGGPAAQPVSRRPHRLRPREVLLGAEERARAVVAAVAARTEVEPHAVVPVPRAAAGGQRRRAHPRRIAPRAPRVALVPAHVVPAAEVGVVVLAAGLEEVWMVRDQHGGHARPAQP